jgi:hypothetical protein
MTRFALAALAVVLAAAAPAAAPMGPDVEAWVVKTAADYAEQYANARNDMAKGLLRSARGRALCAEPSRFKPSQGTVRDWTGTIEQMGALDDGRGSLEVRIAANVVLKTTNNGFSESLSETKTLIPAGSPLLAAVVGLSVGQKIRFSGNFWPSVVDCMEERSVTTSGSMSEPDYMFRFTAVAPAD